MTEQPPPSIAEKRTESAPAAVFDIETNHVLWSQLSSVNLNTNLMSSFGLVPGMVLDDYQLIAEIARGGMGIVFRALQVSADRVVALKVVSVTGTQKSLLKRFETEVRAAAKLDHPHIVPLFDIGSYQGQPFFTMRLLEGGSLASKLQSGPLSSRVAASLVRTIAEAIQYAHSCGVIHRDIKPGNIVLDDAGEPFVTDFGLAMVVDRPSDLTSEGHAVGTPAYISPEQAIGCKNLVDERSDVYSVGAVLYACLTGRPPFQAISSAATVMQLLMRDPVSPRVLDPEIDRDVETICLKCLDKDPQRRYQNSASLASDLQRYLDGKPILARPTSSFERLRKWAKRAPLVASLSAMSALAILTLVVGGLIYQWRLTEALKYARTQQEAAVASEAQRTEILYDSMVKQATFLGETRPIGYSKQIWSAIDQARQLETPKRDFDSLRQLAVGAMGTSAFEQPTNLIPNSPADSNVQCAELCPDEKQVMVGLSSGEVLFFDRNSAREVARLHPHTQGVVGIRFPDEDTCYTYTSFCREIHKWTYRDGVWHSKGPVDTHRPNDMTDVRLSRDGRWIISWTPVTVPDDAGLTLLDEYPSWSPDANEAYFCFRRVEDSSGKYLFPGLHVSPYFDLVHGLFVTYDTESRLRVFDLNQEKIVHTFHDKNGFEGARMCLISPRGDFVAVGGRNRGHLFNLKTGEHVALLSESDCYLRQFSYDGSQILLYDSSQQYVYSLANRRIELKLPAKGAEQSLWFSGRDRFILDSKIDRVSLASASSRECQIFSTQAPNTDDLQLSRDGTSLVTSMDGISTCLWDVASHRLIAQLPGQRGTIHPSGKLLSICRNERLDLYQIPELILVCKLESPGMFNCMRFNRSGDRMLGYGWSGGPIGVFGLKLGDAENPAESLVEIARDSLCMASGGWSPDGKDARWLAMHSETEEATVRGLNQHSVAIESFIVPGTSGFRSLAVLSNETLCLINESGYLEIRNLHSGKLLRTSRQKVEGPICRSPDGRFLFTGHTLYSVDEMLPIVEFPQLAGAMWSSDWCENGRYVAFGYTGGIVAIWDLVAVESRLGELEFSLFDRNDNKSMMASVEPLEPLVQLRKNSLETVNRLSDGRSWESLEEGLERLHSSKVISVKQWLDKQSLYPSGATVSIDFFAEKIIWVTQNAPELSSADKKCFIEYLVGHLKAQKQTLPTHQYSQIMKGLIQRLEAVENSTPTNDAALVIAYMEYESAEVSKPEQDRKLEYYRKADRLAWELVRTEKYGKKEFGHRWYWRNYAFAELEAATGNYSHAVELMTEAVESFAETSFEPEVRFQLLAKQNIETWTKMANQPKVTDMASRSVEEIDWTSGWYPNSFEASVGEMSIEQGVLRLTTIKAGEQDWHVQALQGHVNFQDHQEYVLRFEASSPESRSAKVEASLNEDNFRDIGLRALFKTTPEYKPYEFRFRATNLGSTHRICFLLGEELGTLFIKNMSLEASR